MKKAGGEIGSAEADHLLIRIDRRVGLGGVRPRQDARVRERHHGDGTATDDDVVEVSEADQSAKQTTVVLAAADREPSRQRWCRGSSIPTTIVAATTASKRPGMRL